MVNTQSKTHRFRLVMVALFLVIAIVLILRGCAAPSSVDAALVHNSVAKNCTFINDTLAGSLEQAQPDWDKMELQDKANFVQDCRG